MCGIVLKQRLRSIFCNLWWTPYFATSHYEL